MELSDYLNRISYSGSMDPSLDALATMLRCHVLSIPFENIDVQLGIALTNEVDAAFDKIVERGRGGWCYEQNGLFGWALSQVGFAVTRVAAAVRRGERGNNALANHLCLLVRSPEDPNRQFLADVGFGGSMIRPIPLEPSEQKQTPFCVGLRRLESDFWRFEEQAFDVSANYDFIAEPGDELAMSEKCVELQTDPDSSFVLNLVVQRRKADAHISLRGRVLTIITASGKTTKLLDSQSELEDTLRSEFQLHVPGLADLWPQIEARHKLLFPGCN